MDIRAVDFTFYYAESLVSAMQDDGLYYPFYVERALENDEDDSFNYEVRGRFILNSKGLGQSADVNVNMLDLSILPTTVFQAGKHALLYSRVPARTRTRGTASVNSELMLAVSPALYRVFGFSVGFLDIMASDKCYPLFMKRVLSIEKAMPKLQNYEIFSAAIGDCFAVSKNFEDGYSIYYKMIEVGTVDPESNTVYLNNKYHQLYEQLIDFAKVEIA